MTLRYSKDGGHNWSAWLARDLGDVVQFQKRYNVTASVRRQRAFDIRITDLWAHLLPMSLQASTGLPNLSFFLEQP
ncbi:hypothetical protein [Xylella fastidiosa]|uniref:hypothetical protein n=1 Tax=Xylella fastidiosa TaxID=2371 RepID=UPI0039848BDF